MAMDIWELKQPRRLRKVKHHICAMGTILQLLLFAVKSNNCKIERLAFYKVDKLHYWWTGGSAVDLNIENERSTVQCSRCR